MADSSEALREIADLARMTTNSPFAGAVKATEGLTAAWMATPSS
jgi:hypothetical protein